MRGATGDVVLIMIGFGIAGEPRFEARSSA
jgi:hypothetical protein